MKFPKKLKPLSQNLRDAEDRRNGPPDRCRKVGCKRPTKSGHVEPFETRLCASCGFDAPKMHEALKAKRSRIKAAEARARFRFQPEEAGAFLASNMLGSAPSLLPEGFLSAH